MFTPDKQNDDAVCGCWTIRSTVPTSFSREELNDRDEEQVATSRWAGFAAWRVFGEPRRGVAVLERQVAVVAGPPSPPAVAAADTAAAILP